MICPKCGATLPEGALFCTVCGAKIESAPAQAPEPVKASPAVCPQCGTQPKGGELFCTNCGAPLNPVSAQPAEPAPAAEEPQSVQTSVQMPQAPQSFQEAASPQVSAPMFASASAPSAIDGAPANLKEFVIRYADDKTKKTMKSASIILYVFAALNLVIALMNESFPFDAILLAVLGFWYQKSYSRACSIVLLVYAALSVVLMLVTTGTLGGWLILILGVVVFMATQKAQKAYTEYQKTGQLPMQ